jgi:hypothetical protein
MSFVININATSYNNRYNGSINDQDYLLASTNLKEGRYRCRIAFRGLSEAGAVLNSGNFASIYMSVGKPVNSYSASGAMGLQSSQLVGFTRTELVIQGANTNAYNWCAYSDCPPFYMDYRPGDILRVTLRAGVTTALYAGVNAYFLMIEFEEMR